MNDNIIEIEKWFQLYKEGIISKEEFESNKNEILGTSPVAEKETIDHDNKNGKDTQPLRAGRSSVNFMAIFLGVLGALILAFGGFWFWNQNEKSKQVNSPVTEFMNSQQNQLSDDSILNMDNEQNSNDIVEPILAPKFALSNDDKAKFSKKELNVFESEARRILSQNNSVAITESNLIKLIALHYDHHFQNEYGGGTQADETDGIDYEINPLKNNIIALISSHGTASSQRGNLAFQNPESGEFILDFHDDSLSSIFQKVSERYDIIPVFEGANKQQINGKEYLIFNIRLTSDPSCCTGLKIAVPGKLNSKNKFLTESALISESDTYEENVKWNKL